MIAIVPVNKFQPRTAQHTLYWPFPSEVFFTRMFFVSLITTVNILHWDTKYKNVALQTAEPEIIIGLGIKPFLKPFSSIHR